MKRASFLFVAALAALPAGGARPQEMHPSVDGVVPIVGACPTASPAEVAEETLECIPDEAQPVQQRDPFLQRLLRYAQLEVKHRVTGLASYYSAKFDGRKTANGEIFRNSRYSAAHLTLPLGTWVEVRSRATGRSLRLRVNDRGPYVKKFALDLSVAAARYLGVDKAHDRHVEIRILALPGEEPLPEEALAQYAKSPPAASTTEAATVAEAGQ